MRVVASRNRLSVWSAVSGLYACGSSSTDLGWGNSAAEPGNGTAALTVAPSGPRIAGRRQLDPGLCDGFGRRGRVGRRQRDGNRHADAPTATVASSRTRTAPACGSSAPPSRSAYPIDGSSYRRT